MCAPKFGSARDSKAISLFPFWNTKLFLQNLDAFSTSLYIRIDSKTLTQRANEAVVWAVNMAKRQNNQETVLQRLNLPLPKFVNQNRKPKPLRLGLIFRTSGGPSHHPANVRIKHKR